MSEDVIETGKALIKSKTFWFNVLAALVGIASLFGFAEFVPSENVAKTVAIVGALVNIGLRLKTTQPIDRIK